MPLAPSPEAVPGQTYTTSVEKCCIGGKGESACGGSGEQGREPRW